MQISDVTIELKVDRFAGTDVLDIYALGHYSAHSQTCQELDDPQGIANLPCPVIISVLT